MAVSSRWVHGSPVLCLSAGTVLGCKLPVPGWGQAPLQLHSSWLQAVEQLNIKAKNFRDLLTDEPFSRQDIITLQVCVPSPCCSQEGPPESLGSAPLGHPTSPPSLGGFLPATYLVAVPQLLPTVLLPPASFHWVAWAFAHTASPAWSSHIPLCSLSLLCQGPSSLSLEPSRHLSGLFSGLALLPPS